MDTLATYASVASGCLGGAAGALEIAAPAEPVLAILPGVGEVALAAIPLAGCEVGMVSVTLYDINVLDPFSP